MSERFKNVRNGKEMGIVIDDIYGSRRIFYKGLKRVENWHISEGDKTLIFDFLRRKETEGMSYRQLLRYVSAFNKFLKIKTGFEKLEEKDLETFILSLREFKPYTQQKYWYCIKKFFEFYKRGGIYKNFNIHFRSDKEISYEERWDIGEMDGLIKHTKNTEEATFISLMTEMGYRIGEALNIKLKDIQFFDKYCRIIVKGKTGWRNPPVVRSMPYLLEQVKNKNKEDILFGMSYSKSLNLIKRLAVKSGVNKLISFQIIRFSTYTRDRLTGIPKEALRFKYGWGKKSKMPEHYERFVTTDLDRFIFEQFGIEADSTDTLINTEFEKNKRFGIG